MTQEMRYIAAFDAGTTAVKAALMEESGRAVRTVSEDIPTFFEGGFREQDPRNWWAAFCRLSRRLTDGVPLERIEAVVMSGQMQDLIPLDGDLEPVCRAILYSDGRAQEQAARLERAVGAERFEEITGNRCDGSLPLPKLAWLREERPELFARTRHILISSKDYLIARLTGACIGDVTACSTAGAMDIRCKCWSRELLDAAGAQEAMFPRLRAAGSGGRLRLCAGNAGLCRYGRRGSHHAGQRHCHAGTVQRESGHLRLGGRRVGRAAGWSVGRIQSGRHAPGAVHQCGPVSQRRECPRLDGGPGRRLCRAGRGGL